MEVHTTKKPTKEDHILEILAFLSKDIDFDISKVDWSGKWTPVHRAIEIGSVELVKLVIDKCNGQDLNFKGAGVNLEHSGTFFRCTDWQSVCPFIKSRLKAFFQFSKTLPLPLKGRANNITLYAVHRCHWSMFSR